MLNEKQRRFAEEYVQYMNATQAAIRAGYAERSAEVRASRLLRNSKVVEYIKELRSKRVENVVYDQQYVLDNIAEVIEKAAGRKPTLTPKGPVIKEDHKAVMKGCELLGRYHAMFTDKKQVEGTITLEETLSSIDD